MKVFIVRDFFVQLPVCGVNGVRGPAVAEPATEGLEQGLGHARAVLAAQEAMLILNSATLKDVQVKHTVYDLHYF